MRNQIIKEIVAMAFHHYTAEELLELHLEMDGTPEDIFFEELTDQLVVKISRAICNRIIIRRYRRISYRGSNRRMYYEPSNYPRCDR